VWLALALTVTLLVCVRTVCELTEQVVFTDPFYSSPFNSHTSPQLDDDAAALRSDGAAKAAATALKRTFMESTQALLHGDLHTGSIMVTEASTFVIDCEFAFYGPMGFDVGALVGNLLLAYFATDGQAGAGFEATRNEQRAWLLATVRELWTRFVARFKALWSDAVAHGRTGEGCPSVRNAWMVMPCLSHHRWLTHRNAPPARRCCSAAALARG
jgi:5-methylthioribose kinase